MIFVSLHGVEGRDVYSTAGGSLESINVSIAHLVVANMLTAGRAELSPVDSL